MNDPKDTQPIPVNTSPKTKEETKTNPWKQGFFVLLIVALCLGSVGIGIGASSWLNADNSNSRVTDLLSPDEDGNDIITSDEASIAGVVEKVSPSVVSIITSSQVRSFYGTIDQSGAGTGVFVSKNGYIMTNNHVVDGANQVTVVMNDGTTYEKVKIIGRDPLNDIAFLKIDSNDTFTPVEMGDSSTVRVGQQVIAIGNALGRYDNTVTSGILSGTNRPVTASNSAGEYESLTDLLQTDASINSGNSGGPLLNLAGQIIGVNTAVASDANGIGFAIPINSTKGVLAELLESGKIRRAYAGVTYVDITPEVVQQYDLQSNQGAYVNGDGNSSGVRRNSPAEKAGIKDGDIIQKVDNHVVGKGSGLSGIIGMYRVGDTATVTVLRGDKTLTLQLTFDEYSTN